MGESQKAKNIKTIFEEVKQADRIKFDKMILIAFGIDDSILSSLPQIHLSMVNDRVTMK